MEMFTVIDRGAAVCQSGGPFSHMHKHTCNRCRVTLTHPFIHWPFVQQTDHFNSSHHLTAVYGFLYTVIGRQ